MAKSKQIWQREQARRRRERERRAKRQRICVLLLLLAAVLIAIFLLVRGCRQERNLSDTTEVNGAISAVPTENTPFTPVPDVLEGESVNTSFYDNAVFLGNAAADGINTYGLLKETDFYAGVNIDLENAYTTSAKYTSVSVVDQLKSRKFGKVFLFFGENELAWEAPQRFAELYRELIDDVKEYQPSASIYVFSIPPAAENICNDGSYGFTVENIKAYNKSLKKLAVSEKIYYIDCFAALAQENKYLAEGVSSDGINLNKSSYIKLLNYAAENAYIPDKNSLLEDEEDTDGENGVSSSPKPDSGVSSTGASSSSSSGTTKSSASQSSEEPKPTVNVLKDSHKE